MTKGNPYGNAVHLDHGIYDGLYHDTWAEGYHSRDEVVAELVEAVTKIKSLGYMTSEDADNLTLLVGDTEIEELLYELREAIAKAKGGD